MVKTTKHINSAINKKCLFPLSIGYVLGRRLNGQHANVYPTSFNPLYHCIKGLLAAVSDWQPTDAFCLSIPKCFVLKREPTFFKI